MLWRPRVDSRLRAALTQAQDELLAANQMVAGQLDTITALTNRRDTALAELAGQLDTTAAITNQRDTALAELAGQLDTTAAITNQRDTALAELAATRRESLQARNDVQRLQEEIARRDAEASATSERIGTFPDGAWVTQRPPPGSERVGSTIRMEVHSSEPPGEFARRDFYWQVDRCSYVPRICLAGWFLDARDPIFWTCTFLGGSFSGRFSPTHSF